MPGRGPGRAPSSGFEDFTPDWDPLKKGALRRVARSATIPGLSEAVPSPRIASSPRAEVLLPRAFLGDATDRVIGCRIAGCKGTWTWFADEQLRAPSSSPPARLCSEHRRAYLGLEEIELACSSAGCRGIWFWHRDDQLAWRLREGTRERAPKGHCAACVEAARGPEERPVRCRVPGCTRTCAPAPEAASAESLGIEAAGAESSGTESSGTESSGTEAAGAESSGTEAAGAEMSAVAAEAGTVAPEGAEDEAAAADAETTGRTGRRRRRRRGGRSGEGPRTCEICAQKLAMLVPIEHACRVHGCKGMVVIDRETQLRAFAALHTEDLSVVPSIQRGMCESCREYCRAHADRQVPCARPGCTNTWRYKTGAQLHAQLAGRTADPVRLCASCARAELAEAPGAEAVRAEGSGRAAEAMPCLSPGCSGVWWYTPGMKLAPLREGALPVDRLCASCRDAQKPQGATVEPVDTSLDRAEPEAPTEPAPTEPTPTEPTPTEPTPTEPAPSE